MSIFQLFHERDAKNLVQQLGIFKENQSLTCQQLDTSKQERLYKVSNPEEKCVIIKQPILDPQNEEELIWYRQIADSEANTLKTHHYCCPKYTIKLLYHDAQLACHILQDLSDFDSLNGRLTQLKSIKHCGKQLGEFLALTSFYTSDFALVDQDKTKKLQHITPEVCLSTETRFFESVYQEDQLNPEDKPHHQSILPLLEDELLQAELAELKHKLLSSRQSLLHGSLHFDNILLNDEKIKVTQANKSFYGPIGFDLGVSISLFLISFCTQATLLNTKKQMQQLDDLIIVIRDIWHEFANQFTHLMNTQNQDPHLANETFQSRFIRGIFIDAIGFAGANLIQATCHQTLLDPPEALTSEQAQIINQDLILLGQTLINKRYQFVSIEDLLLEAEAVIDA